tara:strand:+ start:105 stop:749 length:645 start_codon:yes stop_codon:yes gene_type:complete
MDEDISIINTNTRNERIKNFFITNKNKLIFILLFIILGLFGFFGYEEFKKRKLISISNEYNSIILKYDENNKEISISKLVNLVNKGDPTYSPLSLYFIIDNKLIQSKEEINKLFNILIKKTPLEKEIKNLVILKKAFLNADHYEEVEMLNLLNPVINSDSVWKSHALNLMAEFFYFKNQNQKAKEFFNQIISLEESNPDIKKQAQKRLLRDLSE